MYKIGQILYTVITEKQIVIPVKVVEQVIVKTLEGEKVNYKLQLPNSKNQKVSISKFANLYEDIESIESYLTKNAKEAIGKMIKDAVSLNRQFFDAQEENDTCKIESNNDIINHDQTENIVKIELENGQKANINLEKINEFMETQTIEKKT
jgi:hypothetical protein